MRLTKIDVAEAHLVTAVRNTFTGQHPASVYLLAASAREILTQLGHKLGVRTILHGEAEDTGKKLRRLVEAAHEYANFLKHADNDPAGVLDFDPISADQVLFIACHDFARVAKGQPIELQVYEAWWFATAHASVSAAPLRSQPIIRRCIKLFPGIRTAGRERRIALGREALEKASLDSSLVMDIEREVKLPTDDLIETANFTPPLGSFRAKGSGRSIDET